MKNVAVLFLFLASAEMASIFPASAQGIEIYVVSAKRAHHFGPAVAVEYHRINHNWAVVLARPGDYFVQLGVNPGTVISVGRDEAKEVKLPIASVGDTLFVRRLGRDESQSDTMQFLLWTTRRKRR